MRVLHLSSEKDWRGGEQQIAYLIEELEKYGVQNFVACRVDSAFEKHCIDKKIEHKSLSFNYDLDLLTAWQVKTYSNFVKAGILHMHSSRGHMMGALASLFGAKANLILSRRAVFSGSGNWLARYKNNYPTIKKILCVSNKTKEVMSPLIQDKNKLEVVYSGIDLKRFEGKADKGILRKEYGLSEKTKIVANIAALAPYKGHFTFVDTVAEFKKISDENVKFFAIGEGNLREETEQYIAEKGLQDEIILTGFREDIADVFPEIDVFLFTSEKEGLGTTILDAFANKVPVVATAGGGIPEMVEDKKTGMLCSVKDAKSLAKSVQMILNDDNLAKDLTENAYQVLLEKFTKEITAKKTLEIYKQYC